MKTRSVAVKLVVAALVLTASSLWAQDGLQGALSRANFASPLNLSAPFRQGLAIADFDNDQKPDGAVLVDSGRRYGQNSFRIELHLSGSNNTDLAFESAEPALAIATSDINKDGAADVIVEQPITHRRLYVWLGDGHGGFRKGRVEDFPSTEVLSGDRAVSPTRLAHWPALCLPQQRGTETAMLATSFLRGRPPSTNGVASFPLACSPVASARAANSSRAPPFLLSL